MMGTGQNTAILQLDRVRRRHETMWAWLSLVTLIICWDASTRLDARVSPPRARIAHAGEHPEAAQERTTDLSSVRVRL